MLTIENLELEFKKIDIHTDVVFRCIFEKIRYDFSIEAIREIYDKAVVYNKTETNVYICVNKSINDFADRIRKFDKVIRSRLSLSDRRFYESRMI